MDKPTQKGSYLEVMAVGTSLQNLGFGRTCNRQSPTYQEQHVKWLRKINKGGQLKVKQLYEDLAIWNLIRSAHLNVEGSQIGCYLSEKKRQCLFFTQSAVIWENNQIFVFRVPELEENDATETKEAGST
uniref:Uncharacterized protein n=1 Tax=Romanomermis culicivorax TaxID=13658 RepID=A0A915JD34_ROMCU